MAIFVKHTQPFTAVPNYLVNDENISVEALGVITYLAGKPTGWIARAYDIKKRFKWGDFIWRRVAKELKELGILSHMPNADGMQLVFEIQWEAKGVDNSLDKPCEPPVGKPTMDFPPVGNQRIYKERNTKKDLIKKNTSLGGQISGDNSGQLPTDIVPSKNKNFKNGGKRKPHMTPQQEHARRKVLEQQLAHLTNKIKVNER